MSLAVFDANHRQVGTCSVPVPTAQFTSLPVKGPEGKSKGMAVKLQTKAGRPERGALNGSFLVALYVPRGQKCIILSI